MTSKKLVIL
jgi:hypothetical protein